MTVRAKGQPVRCFLAKSVAMIEMPYRVGKETASGNEKNVSAGELFGEPTAESRAEIGQIIEAAADLDDGEG